MNIRKFAIIVIVLLFTDFAYAELTTSQVAKKYSPSVVTIVALDKNDQPLFLGSRFFINTKGNIVTNDYMTDASILMLIF